MKQIGLILLVLLLLSLAGNFIQYKTCKREPVVERDTVTVTITQRDTIWLTSTQYYSVEKPVPVYIHDTIYQTADVKQYHDTLLHEYGKIYRWEWVKGDLLKKDLKLDLNLPTITETVTTTQTITNTVRNPLLFFTAGIRTAPTQMVTKEDGTSWRSGEINTVPTIGLFGISEGHRWAAGVEYGLDRQLTIKVGFALKR